MWQRHQQFWLNAFFFSCVSAFDRSCLSLSVRFPPRRQQTGFSRESHHIHQRYQQHQHVGGAQRSDVHRWVSPTGNPADSSFEHYVSLWEENETLRGNWCLSNDAFLSLKHVSLLNDVIYSWPLLKSHWMVIKTWLQGGFCWWVMQPDILPPLSCRHFRLTWWFNETRWVEFLRF